MPKHTHTIALSDYLREQEQVLLKVLFDEINLLRQEHSLPPRTPPQIKAIMDEAMRVIRRGPGA
jgi:hypothetical protein